MRDLSVTLVQCELAWEQPDDNGRQMGDIIEGYRQFCDFDASELQLIEPLRTLRMLHHAAWLARRWIRHHRANAYRRAALREITAAGQDPAALAEILRRTALSAFPRAEVAGLYGDAWLGFLDRAYGGTGFRDGPGRAIALAPYAPREPSADLAPHAAAWVRRHRRAEKRAP